MANNITQSDLDALIAYLSQPDPHLTHGPKVAEFEREWSKWLSVNYTTMVNSGSSANDLTMLTLKHLRGVGEVVMAPFGWVSDIASVMHAGLTPVFVDIDLETLGISVDKAIAAVTPNTKTILVTHILGSNALSQKLLDFSADSGVPLIEDTCESHGATFKGKKCGSFGWISNFSFYYAHHLTTIEGGAICTNDPEVFEVSRMLRSHGMVREALSAETKARYRGDNPALNPDFIFAYASHNMRPTELQGVVGLSQLPRLDENNRRRCENFKAFLDGLDANKFLTHFDTVESSNYAFILVLKEPNFRERDRIEAQLRAAGIEFRRGLSGGGNQLRQPYLSQIARDYDLKDFPNLEHVHHFGWYIGNYPDLPRESMDKLFSALERK
jgi:CDP-6-deoxy-D-xylo-4-hexulose-3-dehydrase